MWFLQSCAAPRLGVMKVMGADCEEGSECGAGEEIDDDAGNGRHAANVADALLSFAEAGTILDLVSEQTNLTEDAARQRSWTDLDEALKQRSYVYRLDLSRQRLKTVPPDIGKLNKVESLSLRENDLVPSPIRIVKLFSDACSCSMCNVCRQTSRSRRNSLTCIG